MKIVILWFNASCIRSLNVGIFFEIVQWNKHADNEYASILVRRIYALSEIQRRSTIDSSLSGPVIPKMIPCHVVRIPATFIIFIFKL